MDECCKMAVRQLEKEMKGEIQKVISILETNVETYLQGIVDKYNKELESEQPFDNTPSNAKMYSAQLDALVDMLEVCELGFYGIKYVSEDDRRLRLINRAKGEH